MARTATLVVVGNLAQTLEAVISHNILSARNMTQDPDGMKSGQEHRCLTKVTLDGDRYNKTIEAWLNEPIGRVVQPGTLLRAKWS